jgi:hypothetical protein
MAEKPEDIKTSSDELVRNEAQPAEQAPAKTIPEEVKQDIAEEDRFEATDN